MSLEQGLDELLSWSAAQAAEDRVDGSLAQLERMGLVR